MGDLSCRSRELAQRQRPLNEPESQQRFLISLGRPAVLPPRERSTHRPTNSERPFQNPRRNQLVRTDTWRRGDRAADRNPFRTCRLVRTWYPPRPIPHIVSALVKNRGETA